jgi:hypothetical protein
MSAWCKNLAILAASIFLAGCLSNAHHNETLIKYQKGKWPPMMRAPFDGGYSVHIPFDPEAKGAVQLKQGELLGFKQGKSGEVIAIGGATEIPLPDGDYVWKKD